MQKALDWAKTNKRVFVAFGVGVIAALEFMGFSIPAWIKMGLASMGLS